MKTPSTPQRGHAPHLLRATTLIAALLGVASQSPAHAGESTAPAPLPAPATPAAAAAADTASEAILDKANELVIDGKREEAVVLLRQVAGSSTDPALRARAAKLLAQIEKAAPQPVATNSDADENVDGRTRLIATSTAFGASAWGIGVPLALHVDDGASAVGLYLLTSGASFGVPFFATSGEKVPLGVAIMASNGGLVGWGHGLALTLLGGKDAFDGRFFWVLTTAFSMGEFIGGAKYAAATELSAGGAAAIGGGAFFGGLIATGLTATQLLLQDGSGDTGMRLLGGSFLLGSVGGAVLGDHYRSSRHLTFGDTSFLSTSILLGGFAGLVTSDWVGLFHGSDRSGAWAFTLVSLGAAGGAVLGDGLGHDQDLTTGQGFIVDMATTAGGSVLAGLAFLGTGSATGVMTAGLLGGALGYGLGYHNVRKAKPTAAARWIDRSFPGATLPTLAPWFDPAGARGLALSGRF